MRILMTTDTLGGVFSYALELIAGLRQHGVEVVLASCGRELDRSQRAAMRGALGPVEVRESCWPLEWMDEPWSGVQATGDWLEEIAREVQPDCVHLNDFSHGARSWPAPVLVVGHSCVLSWWRATQGRGAPPRYDAYRNAVTRGLHGAQRVVAPSHTMLAQLCRDYGPLPHAQVIANGIDLGQYAPAPKRAQVLAAGRLWDEAKNLTALSRVAPALDWPVYVCGDARAPSGRIETFDEVHTLGPLPRAELAQRLSQAAIYCLPARYEPFGLSVLEAAASGCALVLGHIDSLLENWHGAARFVAPDDDAELFNALSELIRFPSQREDLSGLARERAQRFDRKAMSAAYAQVYRELRDVRGVPEAHACAS